MNNKPKTKMLTIGLLCCGRAETTERCLKSLMPLRNATDSEIQVVDTGCSPETRAIVDKYADEVFEFTWINDFAAARNFQLDQANGKMFLFIDDDEFFLDCSDMIKFFNNPKCVEYNIGGYYQRNYLDFEAVEYQDVEVVRLCTVTPHTYFKGKVHEFIEPSYGNAVFLDAHAGHFGYVYKDPEENFRHSMRNIPLLKDMIEEDPDEMRWPYQLAQEYRAIKYYDELIDICRYGMEMVDRLKDTVEEARNYNGTFVCGIAIAYEGKKQIDELIDFYHENIKSDMLTDLAKAKFSIYAAKALFVKDMNDECIEATEFYINQLNEKAQDKSRMFLESGIFITDVFDDMHINMMYCYRITCALRNNDYGPVVHYYRKIKWNTQVVRINKGFVVTLIQKSMENGYKKEIRDVLDKFFVRPGLRDVMQAEIEKMFASVTMEQLDNLKKAFKTTKGEKEMGLFIDVRMLEKLAVTEVPWSRYSELAGLFRQYIATVNEWDKLHREWMEDVADTDFIPTECRLANWLTDYFKVEEIDHKKALDILKNALGIRNITDSAINNLARLYGDRIIALEAQANDPDKFHQMYELETGLRKQIEDLVAAGHQSEADSVKSQLEGILKQTYGVSTLLE